MLVQCPRTCVTIFDSIRSNSIIMIKNNLSSQDFCFKALKNVSRSFYLNTVALRDPLKDYVCVAYLLCRIADTIEDDPDLHIDAKNRGFFLFETSLKSGIHSVEWSGFVSSLNCSDHEMELANNYQHVLDRFSGFSENIRIILIKNILIMTGGMALYCQKLEAAKEPIEDFSQLDDYCYYVAGVVGELLTDLFAAEMNISDDALVRLKQHSVSFGLALQYTNIIKDYTADDQRGITFWPVSIRNKSSACKSSACKISVGEMSRRCLDHMVTSFDYIISLPKEEKTIRLFCLWPLFFALATLKEINKDYVRFENREVVKVTRKRIKFIMLITSIFYRFDFVLGIYFKRYISSVKKHLVS